MNGYQGIDVVVAGSEVTPLDALDADKWWVVYVKGPLDRAGCVFGGPMARVVPHVAAYAEYSGGILSGVAYPFDDGMESVTARIAIEEHYWAHRPV